MIHRHVALHGHEPVTPSVRMLKYWWGRINREVFDQELLPCQITFGTSEIEEVYGLCYALDNGRARIHIDSRVSTRAGMLATLAHEMVHQHQHQSGRAMNHGSDFTAWSQIIKMTTSLQI